MSNQQPEPTAAAGADAEGEVAAPVAKVKAKSRRTEVRYLGVRTTDAGREYSLGVTGDLPARLFVLLITHDVFAAGAARFQDGPGVCFNRLKRDLEADPELMPGPVLTLTAREVSALRLADETRSPGRRAAR